MRNRRKSRKLQKAINGRKIKRMESKMSKKIQIENILIALDSVKWNLGLIKKSKIKNKYA